MEIGRHGACAAVPERQKENCQTGGANNAVAVPLLMDGLSVHSLTLLSLFA